LSIFQESEKNQKKHNKHLKNYYLPWEVGKIVPDKDKAAKEKLQ